MGYKHIEWNDKWIVENYLRYPSYKAMAEDHNRLFGTTAKVDSIKAHARKLGLKKPREGHYYTPEQVEWLKEYYPKHGCKKTSEEFNRLFGMSKTVQSMKNFGQMYGIKVDKAVATANKIGPAHGEGSKRAVRPVGSTRLECGRLVMKASDGTWKAAGRVVWEDLNGEIPNGYVVTHLDGDTTNVSIDNLSAIPLRYLGLLDAHGLRSTEAEVTKTGIIWCDLHEALQSEVKE